MINLLVDFGFQALNMEALPDFELIERSSITILNFYRYVSCVLCNIVGSFEFYLLVTNI